jgi:hypothetical protein
MSRLTAMPAAFTALHDVARSFNESNDCSVKAICVATGASYAVVHALMAKHGRKLRQGVRPNAYDSSMKRTLAELGYQIRVWKDEEHIALLSTYSPDPVKARKWYKGLTTKQPMSFNKQWRKLACQNLLLFNTGHVSAYKDGEVIDWAHNTAKRIWAVWEVTKA